MKKRTETRIILERTCKRRTVRTLRQEYADPGQIVKHFLYRRGRVGGRSNIEHRIEGLYELMALPEVIPEVIYKQGDFTDR